MKKDGGMAQGGDGKLLSPTTPATRAWLFVPLCVVMLACSGAASTSSSPGGAAGGTDAASRTGLPGDTAGTGSGTGVASGKTTSASDAGNSQTVATPTAGSVDAATGSAFDMPDGGGAGVTGAVDAFVCLTHGVPCGLGLGTCCSDTCFKGACGGCVVEGVKPGPDATCCAGLSVTSEGYCGTAACVPDGTPCGDGTVVCCNDNCNVTCGG